MAVCLLEHRTSTCETPSEEPTDASASCSVDSSQQLSSPHFLRTASEGAEKRLARSLAPVAALMEERGLDFDEARLQIVRERMAQMGIAEDGLPLDDKLFMFARNKPAAPTSMARAEARSGGFRWHTGFGGRRRSRAAACFSYF